MVAPYPSKAIAKLRLTLPPATLCSLCQNPVVHQIYDNREEPLAKSVVINYE
jgi:hypothetical protein